jgi:predicted ATPase/DNA-binding SARP family transcriptional activator
MHHLLEIRTLGGLAITCGPVTSLATRKAEALLVYLAYHEQPQPRESLAELFWPDRPQAQALASMRVTLGQLRKHLAPYVVATRQTIGIDLDSSVWLDISELNEQLALSSANTEINPGMVSRAAEMYHGDFLDGFFIRGCTRLEDWIRDERERLRRSIVAQLRTLIQHELEHDMPLEGITHTSQLLKIDPLHEETQRYLMQLLAQTGQRSAALQQFENFREMLGEALGMAPEDETTALYHAIRDGTLVIDRSQAMPRHNLPSQLTPFVGRMAELDRLAEMIPHNRLITLVGQGGIGKTRLALEFARQQVKRFPQGVHFVALARLKSHIDIVPAIADAVGYQFQNKTRSSQQQLFDYLYDKQLLLVVDNFEHLMEGATLVAEMLQHAPRVTVLATSREALNLSGETVVLLTGLELPEQDETQDLLDYSAVRLFMQSAWQAHPDFDPANNGLQYAAQICRMVDGLPLGVLLAASWIRMISLREIADEIGRNLDFLTTDQRDTPDRHRSLRAVFTSSWQQLSDVERHALMRLSVFRSSFSRQVALHITSQPLNTLRNLLIKSLLHRDPATGRCNIHEAVRQFAHEQLEEANLADDTYERHSQYYLGFLCQRTDDIKGQRQRGTINEIATEFDNIRMAWQWAAEQGHTSLIDAGLECLVIFCEWQNRFEELYELLQMATKYLNSDAPRLQARLQARLTSFDSWHEDRTDELKQLRSLALQENDGFEAAYCLMLYGYAQRDIHSMKTALTEFKNLGDHYYRVNILHVLGFWHGNMGHTEDSARYVQQAYDVARELGHRLGMSNALVLLGALDYLHAGNYERAVHRFEESRTIQAETYPRNTSLIGSILGRLSVLSGDFDDAHQRLDYAGHIANTINSPEAKMHALVGQSLLASIEGHVQDAIQYAEQAFEVYHNPGHLIPKIFGNLALAMALCQLNDTQRAQSHFRSGLSVAQDAHFFAATTWFLPTAAILNRHQPRYAVELLALAWHHPKSAVGWLSRWALLKQLRDELEDTLPADTFAEAWAHGQNASLHGVVDSLLATV